MSLHHEGSVSDLSEPLHPPHQERSALSPQDLPAVRVVHSLGPRTKSQTLLYLLETASLWHMVIIVWLLIYTARSHDSASADGMTEKDKDRCYAAYRAAHEVLCVQIFAFFAIHLAGCIYHAKNALLDVISGYRTRQEESECFRQKAGVAMWFNFGAILFYIWSSLYKDEFAGSISCDPF